MKRYCQTVNLYEVPELIATYMAEHDHVHYSLFVIH